MTKGPGEALRPGAIAAMLLLLYWTGEALQQCLWGGGWLLPLGVVAAVAGLAVALGLGEPDWSMSQAVEGLVQESEELVATVGGLMGQLHRPGAVRPAPEAASVGP